MYGVLFLFPRSCFGTYFLFGGYLELIYTLEPLWNLFFGTYFLEPLWNLFLGIYLELIFRNIFGTYFLEPLWNLFLLWNLFFGTYLEAIFWNLFGTSLEPIFWNQFLLHLLLVMFSLQKTVMYGVSYFNFACALELLPMLLRRK